MNRSAPRVIAAGVVALLVIVTFITFHSLQTRREKAILAAGFPRGTPRSAVIEQLGEPDQELSGAALASFAKHPCAPDASSMLGYMAGGSSGGPFLEVYFDGGGRVLCVAHGVIAL